LDGQPGEELYATNSTGVTVVNARAGTVNRFETGYWSTLSVPIWTASPARNCTPPTYRCDRDLRPCRDRETLRNRLLEHTPGAPIWTASRRGIVRDQQYRCDRGQRPRRKRESLRDGAWSTLQLPNSMAQPGQELYATNSTGVTVISVRAGTVKRFETGPWSTLQRADLDGQPGENSSPRTAPA